MSDLHVEYFDKNFAFENRVYCKKCENMLQWLLGVDFEGWYWFADCCGIRHVAEPTPRDSNYYGVYFME